MEERKESWTNKLIELLNRYIKEKELWNTVKEIDDDFFVNNYNNWDWYLCEQVMSKNFWFIERLVKNDKIDFRKADADISKDIVLWREPDFADFMVYRRFLDEEKVLMLLSIQDNPIEFLCSVLK